ncbi:hypothetical protein ACLKA7_015673 [Drosophila subpalustris]
MVNTRSGKTTSKEEASDDNSDHASDSPRLDKTMVQASTSNAAAIKKALTIRTQTSQKSTKVRKLQIEMEHFKAQQEILQQRALLDYKQRQNEMQRQLEIAQLEDDIDDQDANQDPDAESNEAENRTRAGVVYRKLATATRLCLHNNQSGNDNENNYFLAQL